MLERDTVEVVLQVNGKLRDRLQVPATIGEGELVALARASERVQAHLDGGEPRKTIVVPASSSTSSSSRRPRGTAGRATPGRTREPAHNRDGGVCPP